MLWTFFSASFHFMDCIHFNSLMIRWRHSTLLLFIPREAEGEGEAEHGLLGRHIPYMMDPHAPSCILLQPLRLV